MKRFRLAAAVALATAAAWAGDAPTGLVEGELAPAAKGQEPLVYAIFLPRSYDPSKPAPLLVALHGGTGTAAQIANFFQTFAEAHGAIIAAPQGSQEIVGASGYWWESSAAEIASLERFLVYVKKTYAVDASRVVLFGLADGGELAARFALGKDRGLRGLILLNILWRFEGQVRAPRTLKVVAIGSRDAVERKAKLGEQAEKARDAIARAKVPVVARVIGGESKTFFHGWEDEFSKAMEWFQDKRDWPKELAAAAPPPAPPPSK